MASSKWTVTKTGSEEDPVTHKVEIPSSLGGQGETIELYDPGTQSEGLKEGDTGEAIFVPVSGQ
jgi:hypothetical protein